MCNPEVCVYFFPSSHTHTHTHTPCHCRHWTSHLTALRFETADEKREVLQRLRDVCKVTLVSAHAITDRAMRCLDCTLLIAQEEDAIDHAIAYLSHMREFERIHAAYTQFEGALKSAGARVPLTVMAKWRHMLKGQYCTICIAETDEDEPTLVLPCSHAFHESCGERWLHMNATCPSCRAALTDTDRRADEAGSVPADEPECGPEVEPDEETKV